MPHNRPDPRSYTEELSFARRIISDEASTLQNLAQNLTPAFGQALDLLECCADAHGTVLITGLGKSGLIGQKIAATLASLGVASHYVHPAEAAHGDLGRFRPTDAVIAISNSGETDEVVNLASILKQDGIPIIAVTGGSGRTDAGLSSLERLASVTLHLHFTTEAGAPDFAAPTSSTTATLALGDAIALALARRREFTDADFAKRHPGGAIGGMLRSVMDVLRFRADKPSPPAGDPGFDLPLIIETLTVAQALQAAAKAGRRPGAMLIINAAGQLSGIFTDGDLRRLILRDAAELHHPIARVMTRSPRTLRSDALVKDAVLLFRECRQDEIPIVDTEGQPVGLLDVQDLIAMRLVR